jgi:hypothetical protein
VRSQFHQRGHHLAQRIELGTLGAEHCAQDHVEGDPVRRRQYRELPALGPGGDLLERFFLNEILIRAHPLAVKRRNQQLAASAMLFVLQPERRTGAQHQVEIGFHIAHDIGSRLEELLHQCGIADDDRRPEERQPHGERAAIALAQGLHHAAARCDVCKALEGNRPAWPRGQVHRRGHGTATSGAALVWLRRRRTDSSRPRLS